jgi:hypothetical protein
MESEKHKCRNRNLKKARKEKKQLDEKIVKELRNP